MPRRSSAPPTKSYTYAAYIFSKQPATEVSSALVISHDVPTAHDIPYLYSSALMMSPPTSIRVPQEDGAIHQQYTPLLLFFINITL